MRPIRKILAVALCMLLAGGCGANSSDPGGSPNSSPSPSPSPSPTERPGGQFVWGVDSASAADEAFCACIVESYGEPAYFGRYLETKEGVSYGLTQEEVKLLHSKTIKILPIYNHFTDATGYENGVDEAKRAVTYAEELGVTEGVLIFADVEPGYPVDSDFLKGWADEMLQSKYEPGLYGVFEKDSGSNLLPAYLNMIRDQPERKEQVAVWTSDVDYGVSTKKTAPTEFDPEAEAYTQVDIWQYGIDGDVCNIDTNLARAEVMEHLW